MLFAANQGLAYRVALLKDLVYTLKQSNESLNKCWGAKKKLA